MFATIIAFLHRAIMQGIPLLFGSTGEIITEKSGNLNLGIPGVMYIGGMSGVIGAFVYENSLASPNDANGFLAVIIPLLASLLGSLLAGLIYCFFMFFVVCPLLCNSQISLGGRRSIYFTITFSVFLLRSATIVTIYTPLLSIADDTAAFPLKCPTATVSPPTATVLYEAL